MDWSRWHHFYETSPSLQSRLQSVCKQIAAAVSESPAGPVRIASLCAGDGRDLIQALRDHPRRNDVTALLLDIDPASLARGEAAAGQAALSAQFRYVAADAALARNYAEFAPFDLLLLSGMLGHLRHDDLPHLIKNLRMFCRPGASVIWNRHVVMHDGSRQIPAIREYFRGADFEEAHFEDAAPDGFAVGRVRFHGESAPLDPSLVLFEFVGLDQLSQNAVSASPEETDVSSEIARKSGQSIPDRFRRMVDRYPDRLAAGSGAWQPDYRELNTAANRLAHQLISHGGAPGDRVALILRHDTPLLAAMLAVLKAGRIVVVLNPGDPPARLRQVIDDAEPGIIIVDPPHHALAETVADGGANVLLCDLNNPGPEQDPEVLIGPGAPAFLIYTSGSTGNPKGVIQTHRNVIHNALRLSHGIGMTADDRLSLFASPSGGLGVSTTWCALLNGAALFPFPVAEKGVAGLAGWIEAQEITVLASSASLFRNFIQSLAPAVRFPGVRLVRLASEISTAGDFAAWRRHFPEDSILLNSLSSSETGNITQHPIAHGHALKGDRLPIGRPAPGIEILLLDEAGRPVAPGDPGEIVVRSRYLSPGYWRNETLTAERYFGGGAADPEIRLFRTGDLARRRGDGVLEYLGRMDDRVKIRGYRVEISEIEKTLAMQPGVERAVVSARSEGKQGEETRLTAWVAAKPGHRSMTTAALREMLSALLPASMIPFRILLIEEFPLTPHGKIDRAKLARMVIEEPEQPPHDPPVTPAEILLAGIWEKVLGRSGIGRSANFFHLGGDSLGAALVAARVRTDSGIELDLRSFSTHPTLARLAEVIDRLSLAPGPESRPPITRAPRGSPFPLSFEQERTFRHSEIPGESKRYTVARAHRLRGPVDAALLRQSMEDIARRHEILRTTFDLRDGQPVQIVHPPSPAPLAELDLSELRDPEAGAARLLHDEARKPFDLQRGPLLRFLLIKLRPEEHWLLRVNHHIISDGWSWNIYFHELSQIYSARRRGKPLPLPAEQPIQYGDYAVWQRRVFNPKGPLFRESVKWWKRRFKKRAPRRLKLPFSRPQPLPDAGLEGTFSYQSLEHHTCDRLDRIAREEGATSYIVRLAALTALLAHGSEQRVVVIGAYVTNRTCLESQNLFGFFSNLVTLRFDCNLRLTFREWIGEVRVCLAETQAHAGIPYESLCEELRKQKVNPPAIDLIFNIADPRVALTFDDLELTWQASEFQEMPWGVTIGYKHYKGEYCCQTIFDARLHDPHLVHQWTTRHARLLDQAAASPDLPLSNLLA